MSKKCAGCLCTKPSNMFNKSRFQRSGLRTRCKACERAAARSFYKRNPGPYQRRAKASKKKITATLKRCSFEIRKAGCSFCGEVTPCVIDFHHTRKGSPVAHAITHSFARFLREVNKCVLVCANCHRKCHAGIIKPTPAMNLKISMEFIRRFHLSAEDFGLVTKE